MAKKKGLTPSVEETAGQLLAAGKAAFEKAQEAVGKAQKESSRIINSLAKEGEKVKDQTQKLAEDVVDDIKGKVGKVKGKAADTLDNLEQIFEDRVARVLNRMGIPTREDFQYIARRLETLNVNVRELLQSRAAKPAATKDDKDDKDDLKEISGIGPALESKLNAQGITSYRKMAALSSVDIKRLENEVIHSAGRFARDGWIQQAKDLHFRKYHESL